VHRVQDLGPGNVTVIDRLAQAARLVDKVGVQVDRDEGDFLGPQARGDGGADPAEARDHHVIRKPVGLLRRLLDPDHRASLDPLGKQAAETVQERRRHHGQRYAHHQELPDPRRHHADRHARAQQYE
jgi:hypothetical protein